MNQNTTVADINADSGEYAPTAEKTMLQKSGFAPGDDWAQPAAMARPSRAANRAPESDLDAMPTGAPAPAAGQTAAAYDQRQATASEPIADGKWDPIKSRLFASKEVQSALKTARDAQTAFYAKCAELHDLLNPADAMARLDSEMDAATDSATIESIRAKLAEIRSPEHEAAQRRAQELINQSCHAFTDTLPGLLAATDEAIAKLSQEANDAETVFFSKWRLPRHATAVSQRLHVITQELAHLHSSMKEWHLPLGPHVIGRSAMGHVLDWYGEPLPSVAKTSNDTICPDANRDTHHHRNITKIFRALIGR